MLSQDNVKVICPESILTAATVVDLLEQFDTYLASGGRYLLINLAKTAFIDSSGLGTLVSMHTKLRLAGGKLYLCGLQEQARCLFEIADMETLFEVFYSEKEFFNIMVYKTQAVLQS